MSEEQKEKQAMAGEMKSENPAEQQEVKETSENEQLAGESKKLPEQPAAPEPPMPKSYTYDQAMAMLKDGKTMQMADNGKGLMLPGVLHVLEPKNMIQLVSATVLAPGLQVAAMQLVFVNIMPIGGNQVCLRFYTPDDFNKESLWIDVSETMIEPAQQTNAAEDEQACEDTEQSSNVKPLFPNKQ